MAKITSYAPNLPDKVVNILTGTVTLTIRSFMNNKGRFLQLAKEENVFGGGRFNFVHDTCLLNMEEFVKELTLAQGDIKTSEEQVEEVKPAENIPATVEETTGDPTGKSDDMSPVKEEVTKRRTRKKRKE